MSSTDPAESNGTSQFATEYTPVLPTPCNKKPGWHLAHSGSCVITETLTDHNGRLCPTRDYTTIFPKIKGFLLSVLLAAVWALPRTRGCARCSL